MDVYVLSDSPQDAKRLFKKVDRLKGCNLIYLPTDGYKALAKEVEKPTILYLDVTPLSAAERTKIFRSFDRIDNLEFAILDPRGTVEDVASVIHQGAFDYVGKALWKEGITPGRFKQAIDYSGFELEDGVGARGSVADSASGDWSGISSGKSYTFCLMFFELTLDEDWRKKSGKAHLDRVASALEGHLQRVVAPAKGRLWIWSEYGGVILFPFDGTSCDAILLSYRLMLNRTITSAEDYNFDTLLSYRIALHIGPTTYQPRGSTGTIISDTVNFLFHLGRGFAQPNNFYLTDPVRPFIPKGLEDAFVPSGSFEGIDIFRMRNRVR